MGAVRRLCQQGATVSPVKLGSASVDAHVCFHFITTEDSSQTKALQHMCISRNVQIMDQTDEAIFIEK